MIGCDIFDYDPDLQSCLLMPHTRLKDKNWFEFTSAVLPSEPARAIYVLQCSTSQVNDYVK